MRPDAARALLGCRSLSITDTYAELDQTLARKTADQHSLRKKL
jgi:hypothetical protein